MLFHGNINFHQKMGTEGIEPPSSVLETDILPVYYAPYEIQEDSILMSFYKVFYIVFSS